MLTINRFCYARAITYASVRCIGCCGGGRSSCCRLNGISSVRQLHQLKGRPNEDENNYEKYPRKVFSGIQPTGRIHLGNYLGAVKKWIELQNNKDDVTYCIVDMHSITIPQDPIDLHNNILEVAATMLACGIEPEKSTVFVQSSVKEHSELCWILGCFSTMARLGHLPQYKEKTRSQKEIPLGLYVYPILQAADILLYKATHVPVGEDQIQHIQLTQHLARLFNNRYGSTFPISNAIIDNGGAARVRSLRDPGKKMSKSDPDRKATIYLTDKPEAIVEKIKKAVTDFTSDVTYEPNIRPGVSNLVAIHALVTDSSIEEVVEEAHKIDTARYKMRVADAVVEHLKPIRNNILSHLEKRMDLLRILDMGALKARQTAQQTLTEVKEKMGLGLMHTPPLPIAKDPDVVSTIRPIKTGISSKASASVLASAAANASQGPVTPTPKGPTKPGEKPIVPIQKLRVEKKGPTKRMEFRLDLNPNAHGSLPSSSGDKIRPQAPTFAANMTFRAIPTNSNMGQNKKPEPPKKPEPVNLFKMEPLMNIDLIKKNHSASSGNRSESSSSKNYPNMSMNSSPTTSKRTAADSTRKYESVGCSETKLIDYTNDDVNDMKSSGSAQSVIVNKTVKSPSLSVAAAAAATAVSNVNADPSASASSAAIKDPDGETIVVAAQKNEINV